MFCTVQRTIYQLSSTLAPIGRSVVASHPRSGTHLLIDLLRRQLPACDAWKYPGERLDRLYLNADHLFCANPQIAFATASRIANRSDALLVKTHVHADLLNCMGSDTPFTLNPADMGRLLQRSHILYAYRDGRDAICSYHALMHDITGDNVTISEFMRQQVNGMSRVREWVAHVDGWINRTDAYLIKMEEITGDTSRTLKNVSNHLGLDANWIQPLLPPRLRGLWHSRMNRLFSAHPISTAILSVRSSSRTGEWRESFTLNDRRYFEREAGEMLFRLGYEATDRWVDDPTARQSFYQPPISQRPLLSNPRSLASA